MRRSGDGEDSRTKQVLETEIATHKELRNSREQPASITINLNGTSRIWFPRSMRAICDAAGEASGLCAMLYVNEPRGHRPLLIIE